MAFSCLLQETLQIPDFIIYFSINHDNRGLYTAIGESIFTQGWPEEIAGFFVIWNV